MKVVMVRGSDCYSTPRLGRRSTIAFCRLVRLLTGEQIANILLPMKRGDLLAHSISFALGKAQKVCGAYGLG
jgi:hypothetical protein